MEIIRMQNDTIAFLTGTPADGEGWIFFMIMCLVFFCLGITVGCAITAKQLDRLCDLIEKKEGKV